MYEAVTRSISPRSKRDWPLVVALGGAVALILALTLSLVYVTSLTRRHNAFLQNMATSLVYAREHDTLTASLDGSPLKMSSDQVSMLYERLADEGMGRPNNAEPSDGLALSFGDGSSLQLCRVDLKEGEGLLVRYVSTDGSAFAYDTDRLKLADLTASI